MTQLEETLMQRLNEMSEMHKKELEIYEESLKKIVQDLGESYKMHLMQEEEIEPSEESTLIAYFKYLIEQNEEIITLLKEPSPADSVAKQLQPILQQFFQNLETRLMSSNQALIEEIQDSLKMLGR